MPGEIVVALNSALPKAVPYVIGAGAFQVIVGVALFTVRETDALTIA